MKGTLSKNKIDKPSYLAISFTIMFVSKLKFVCFYTSEWAEGQVTEYLVATFGDYFSDVKMYVSLFYSGDAI